MFVDFVPRHLIFASALVAWSSLAGCADTRGGSIPYDRPLAAPDAQTFQTLGRELQDRTDGHAHDQGFQGRRSVRRL